MHKHIIADYDEKVSLYKAFCQKVEHLVMETLEDSKINYHSVTSRVKDRDSFLKKLERSTGKYTCLNDLTDIAGIRIITYFEDDVDRVAKMLAEEFTIDIANSIDKRTLLDPDRFGYLSLHHVVSLHPRRSELTEYKRFPELKAEIQTRSILQHAWAEIEHDLGYKAKKGIPKSITRSFSRLAGLLEIADKGFLEIRDQLAKYEESVPTEILRNPQEVFIDKLSLTSFIESNEIIKKLDLEITSLCGAKLAKSRASDYDAEGLYFVGINTISELEDALRTNHDLIIAFAKEWLNPHDLVGSGISEFYLRYVLVGKTGDIERAVEYVELCSIGSEEGETAEDVARSIITTYHKVVQKCRKVE